MLQKYLRFFWYSEPPGAAPAHDDLFSADSPDKWHLLRTKSRQEKALSANLSRQGVSHYLPLVKQKRTYGHRKTIVETPLFPGYLFLRGTIDDCYEADRTERVAQIIPVSDQTKLNWELKNLAMAIDHEITLD